MATDNAAVPNAPAGTAERVIQRLEDANAGGFFHCEADREEAIEIVAEEIAAALASSAGAGAGDRVAEACKPWRFGAGAPPSDDSPLIGPYSAGIGYAIDMLAKITNAGDYVGADGSETFDGDVRGTIMNVLRAAKLYDDEDGRFATLSAAGAGAWQPIKTAPKDGTRLLCLTRLRLGPKGGPYRTEFEWNVGHFDDETGAWFAEEGADIDPSHWQPLPPPPDQSPAVPASPIKGGGTPTWPASYQETFDAIAAAVTLREGNSFGISVKAFYRALAYPETASPPAPAEHGVTADAIEAMAEHLLEEEYEGWTWPAHADDDGYRGGGYARLAPPDIQARLREKAKRVLGRAHQIASKPALSQGGAAGRSERAVEIRELSDRAAPSPWGDAHLMGNPNDRILASRLVNAYRSGELVHRSEIAGRSEKGEGETLERVRHVKRGTEYEVLGEAQAQVSDGEHRAWRKDIVPFSEDNHVPARLVHDGQHLTVYRCLRTGKLWCRFMDEFRDGRFVPSAPAQSPSTSDREG